MVLVFISTYATISVRKNKMKSPKNEERVTPNTTKIVGITKTSF